MSVFLINDCKITNCGKIFATLSDLIRHIEREHLDFHPDIIEQAEKEKPECIPLSYVLRFEQEEDGPEPKEEFVDITAILQDPSKFENIRAEPWNFTCDIQEEEIPICESLDNEYTIHYDPSALTKDSSVRCSKRDFASERPFICPVPGCSKRYKNINGIKYHFKNGHKESESSHYKQKLKRIRSFPYVSKTKDFYGVHNSVPESNMTLPPQLPKIVTDMPTNNYINLASAAPNHYQVVSSARGDYEVFPITLENVTDYKSNVFNAIIPNFSEAESVPMGNVIPYEDQNILPSASYENSYW